MSFLRPFFIGRSMDRVNKKCGERIRHFREKQGMLQRELAEKSGLRVKTIGRIERAEVDVRIGTLVKISSALGLNIKKLFE